MKKGLLLFVALCSIFSIMVVGCKSQTLPPSGNGVVFVTFNNQRYKVTNEEITDIGKELGAINNDPNDKSSIIYEIKGIDPAVAVARKLDDGKYIKLVH